MPGEIHYAERILYGENPSLLVALTPAQAEERHRLREAYVLAARLPDGFLVLIARTTIWDPRSPHRTSFRGEISDPDIRTNLYGRLQSAHCSPDLSEDGGNVLEVDSLSVHEQNASSEIWYCSMNFEKSVRRVWDYRSGERVFSETTVSSAERELRHVSNSGVRGIR